MDRADVGQDLASRSSLTYGSTIDGRGVHYVIVGSAKLVTMVV
ncbi:MULTISPECIES: hypothetical protein [Nocardioides]|uniref:Uncharacterized protein n=1 Tax=Nocardioides vastitatis TaxID=2568655 RepID=A0ABW0ZJH8_9ACTN|nr:hypothetical protein [Nocardioides sp.]